MNGGIEKSNSNFLNCKRLGTVLHAEVHKQRLASRNDQRNLTANNLNSPGIPPHFYINARPDGLRKIWLFLNKARFIYLKLFELNLPQIYIQSP